jgi:hypothetical protein
MRRPVVPAAALAALFTLAPVPSGADSSRDHRIDAVIEPGAPEIWGPAQVTVRAPSGRVVAQRHAVPAVVELPAAATGYTVTVVYGSAAARTRLTPGGTRVALDAGELSLALVPGDDRRAPVTPRRWQVYRYAPGSATGALVARSDEPAPTFVLSEGWYEVVATHAYGRTAHVVEAKAGRSFDYAIVGP